VNIDRPGHTCKLIFFPAGPTNVTWVKVVWRKEDRGEELANIDRKLQRPPTSF
jgi:hypothetical protein